MLKLLRIHPILLPKIAYGMFHYCCVLIKNIYIKDFHFSETLKRQSLKIWSHINSTLHHPFTCKLKRLRKDNYHSGVTTLSIASLWLNLVKLKFNNAVSFNWVVLHIRVLFVCPQRRLYLRLWTFVVVFLNISRK
jgi:hypothetical protein